MKEEKKNMKGFFEKLSKVPGFDETFGDREEDEEKIKKKPKKKKIKEEQEEDRYMTGGFSDDEEFDYGGVQAEDVSEPEDFDEKEKEKEEDIKIKKEDFSSDEERRTKKRKNEISEGMMPQEKKKKIETTSNSSSSSSIESREFELTLKNAVVEFLTTQQKVTIAKLSKYLIKTRNFDKSRVKEALTGSIKNIAKLVSDKESGEKILVLK